MIKRCYIYTKSNVVFGMGKLMKYYRVGSLHTLHVLSHSMIALQRVQAPYHNVTLKLIEKG